MNTSANMRINRREFVLLTIAGVAGCAGQGGHGASSNAPAALIDAGPVSDYAAQGVYDAFRERGFFVVNRDAQVFAVSAICTHRDCLLKVATPHSMICKCHGSTFESDGAVTKGPATRNLPRLETSIDERGHLIVSVPSRLAV